MTLDELKEQVWLCNIDLFQKGLFVHTFGNVSGYDKEREIVAIKPSGVPYELLKKEDIVLVDLENRIIEGSLKPSSDTKTHVILYKTFPEFGGIVHTHSPYATAWAQAKKPIPCFGTTHADYADGEIPCTEDLSDEQILGDYELETGKQIIKKLVNSRVGKFNMILASGHAPFTWGKDPQEAVINAVLLEEIARLAFFTITINPLTTSLNNVLIKKHFLRKHGSEAYYGQIRNHNGVQDV